MQFAGARLKSALGGAPLVGLVFIAGCVHSGGRGRLPAAAAAAARTSSSNTKVLDPSGYAYDPSDRSCDGFPRLDVQTMPGTCLGLVLPRARAVDSLSGKALAMPRTILQLKQSEDFLVVDMGGWKPNNGSLYLMRKTNGVDAELLPLKTGLNLPHGLTYSPDGFIYLGESHQISRFHIDGKRLTDWQTVIGEVPRFKGYMHPLTQIAFDPRNGDLYVNAGAPSDHCQVKESGTYVQCPETAEMGLGAIFRYPGEQLSNLPAGGLKIREQTASGLRNSMAMVVSKQGFLIQGENGRDFTELEEPYEEINVINPTHKGRFYGWPQCYNFHAVSPEWQFANNDPQGLRHRFTNPVDCGASKKINRDSNYKKPHALIPPHAAPLHADYYRANLFGELKGQLLMTWHGYQPTGHRLVAYPVDQFGRPLVKKPDAGAIYFVDQKDRCAVAKPFSPRGGLDQYAPYTEVISGWDERKGSRPKGAPVAFTVAHDGSIYIVEDRDNRTIVRLARSASKSEGEDCAKSDEKAVDPRIELLAWRSAIRHAPSALEGYLQVQQRLVQKYCSSCHGGMADQDIAADRFSTLDFLVKNGFFAPGNAAHSKMYGAITQAGDFPPMPPGGALQLLEQKEGPAVLALVKNWIDGLPTNVDQSFTRIEIGSARTLRAAPGQAGAACGQLAAGDTIYVDGRSPTRPVKDGWTWTRVYMLPGDSRLLAKCAYPEDGVFYVALKRQ